MTGPTWRPGNLSVTGDATQTVIGTEVTGNLIQQMNNFVRGRPAMYLSSEEVADRIAHYVPAGNHDLIVKALELDRAVVLTGPPGCGRETTGIAAIRQLRPDIMIRRFSLEDDDAEEISTSGNCAFVIHAADGLSRLARCVESIRSIDGYLVVVDAENHHRTSTFLSSMAVEVPRAIDVFRHRMTVDRFNEWPHWDQAPLLLENALPTDARRLAEIVEEVGGRGGDLATQQAEVSHAYGGWKKEICQWFDSNQEPHVRALLVVATALEPAANYDRVYSLASALTQRLEITVNGGGLAWPPVTGVATLLGAQREDDRIVFRRHSYARSVLRHVLTDYPLARSDLLTWLADLVTDDAVRDPRRNSLAAAFADLAAEHGAAELIAEAARKWAHPDVADNADAAFIALSRTCLHPRVGGRIRLALYNWSRASQTRQTLKLVIARVCEPLGQAYPQCQRL